MSGWAWAGMCAGRNPECIRQAGLGSCAPQAVEREPGNALILLPWAALSCAAGRRHHLCTLNSLIAPGCLFLAMRSSFSREPPYLALQGDGIGYENIGRILEAAMAEGYSVEVGVLQQLECICAVLSACVQS